MKNKRPNKILFAALAAMVIGIVAATSQIAAAGTVPTGIDAKFRPIAQLPSTATVANASVTTANSIIKHPALPSSVAGSAYNSWFTVADSRGRVYLVNAASYTAGVTNPNRTIVDFKTATQGLFVGSKTSGKIELGLRWFRYHPDFATAGAKGYMKAYSMSCHDISTRTLAGAVPLDHDAPPGAPTVCDNVLMEWTLNPSTMTASSPRQMLRWPQLYTNHGADALVFDPATKLLYVAVGDGGKQGDIFSVVQNKNYLYGKILRIDPTLPDAILPAGMVLGEEGTFSCPTSNPYAGASDSGRNGIYVIGLRHPESMIKDGKDLFVFDIGRNTFEEINVLHLNGDEGQNFGWGQPLLVEGRSPVNTATVPPVAGYTHVGGTMDPLSAIIGGVAPTSGPFAGKVIFGDIVSGEVYYGDRVAMKAARSWSKPMVPLQQFVMHDNAGTPLTLMTAYGRDSRVDLRLVGISGRVLGVSKQAGIMFELLPM